MPRRFLLPLFLLLSLDYSLGSQSHNDFGDGAYIDNVNRLRNIGLDENHIKENKGHIAHNINSPEISLTKDVKAKGAPNTLTSSTLQPNHYNTPQPLKATKPDAAVTIKDIYFIVIVIGCSVAGLIGIIVAAICWYKLQKNAKATTEIDYPAYGVTGPTKERLPSPGDRKLAQSAQMYHYQHQKQQMIALEKANGEMKHDASDEDSEEENEEGDYTVYECPGLAPTGEMEVKNPLFSDESSVVPAVHSEVKKDLPSDQ